MTDVYDLPLLDDGPEAGPEPCAALRPGSRCAVHSAEGIDAYCVMGPCADYDPVPHDDTKARLLRFGEGIPVFKGGSG